jgi:hypothetical protein
MMISHGNSTKTLTLYPPANPSDDLENSPWIEDSKEEPTQPLLTLDQASTFTKETKDDFIFTYIVHPHTTNHLNFGTYLRGTLPGNLFTNGIDTATRWIASYGCLSLRNKS